MAWVYYRLFKKIVKSDQVLDKFVLASHNKRDMPDTSLPSPLEKQITDFLEYLSVEKNSSKLTIRDYKHYLLVFSDWYSSALPGKTLEHLDLATVRKFRVFLSERIDAKGMTLARVTQNYYIIALRSFLKFLIKNDYKTLEPTKIDLPKTESRSLKFLDREQVERLVMAPDTSEESGVRDRAILELLFSTGLRVSELCKLNHEKVNIERREFGVIGKGGRARVVFISDRAATWISKYLSERKDTFKPLFIRYSGKVEEENGGEKMRLTPRSVERMVKKYVKAARIPVDATVHTMRHSFATDLLTNGADLRSVQEMLGHKNIATTQIYTHVTNKQLRDIHKNFHSGNKED
ncbi:MAG TPA: tyrosine-type recombinase/integrase [Patescibacteria group bacterium]|nr:tyrosine-type recombinase/integrase [Patescibacteria group bacterium]